MAKNKKRVESEVTEQNQITTKPTSSNDKNIVNVVWDFLSSMKLGISLLLILALVSIIGTIWIPTDPITGQQDFTVFYNNIIFKLLLGLLALNLLVCSLNRWKAVSGTLRGPKSDISDNFVKGLKSAQSAKLKTAPAQTVERVKELLKHRGYRIFPSQDGDVYKVAADRGHLGIIGPYLTHISFLVMLVAVVIKFSGLVGFDGSLTGMVGQTYNLGQVQGIRNVDPSEYFDIRINNFRTEYRPNGQDVKQWYSDVTVIDQDKTFDYSIYVNNPLVYKGIKFYQMSYGAQFSGKLTSPGAKDQPFTLAQQDYVQPPNNPAVAFVPMGFDDAAKKVILAIYNGQQQVAEERVALNAPYKYQDSEITFTAADSYTVLSVKRDPGVPAAGVASILLIVGVLISFLLRQRRIWTVVSPDKEGTLVQIGGISAKDKRGLDKDLDDIMTELK